MNKSFYQLQKYWLTGINRKLFHPQILFGASLVRWCNFFKFQIKTNLYQKKKIKNISFICAFPQKITFIAVVRLTF